MRITMIGAGYVELVSGACFADFGHDVTCVDFSELKIAALKYGRIPTFESGLEILLAENAKAGRLSFVTELAPAVAQAEVVFIRVGTLSRQGNGHADHSYVYAAAGDIARALKGFTSGSTSGTFIDRRTSKRRALRTIASVARWPSKRRKHTGGGMRERSGTALRGEACFLAEGQPIVSVFETNAIFA